MLKFAPPHIKYKHFILFRDDTHPELFYYLNQSPQISFFKERPALLIEYELENNKIRKIMIRFKVNFFANPIEKKEIYNYVRTKFRVRNPFIAPANLTKGQIHLQLTHLKELAWTSEIEQRVLVDRNTQIASFTAENDIAEKLYLSIVRGGFNVQIHFKVGVFGKPTEMPAEMFVQWTRLFKKFNFSLNSTYSTTEIYDLVSKWMVKHLDDIEFHKLDESSRIDATQDMVNEVYKMALKRLFIKQHQYEHTPVSASQVDSIYHSHDEQKFFLKDSSDIYPDAEVVRLYWKNNKSVDFNFKMTFKDLVRNIQPIEQYFEDVTNAQNDKVGNIYIAIAHNTFDFVNIRKVEVQVDIYHKKSDNIEKKLNFTFEKGDSYLLIAPIESVDKNSSYDLQFRVFYSIVENNNYTIQTIEKQPRIENKSHLYIDPSIDFNVYHFRFLLDKAKRLSIFDMIIAKIHFTSQATNASIWQISKSLDKESSDNTFAFVSTHKKVETKINVEYYTDQIQIANIAYSNNTNNCFIVDNPFENCWEVEVSCEGDWQKTRKILLEAYTYELDSQTIYLKKIEFDESNLTKTIGFPLKHSFPQNRFYYRIVAITTQGSILCQSGLKHVGETLKISDQIQSTRTIHAYLPDKFDFSNKPYQRIGWTIRYIDRINKIHFVSEPQYFTATQKYQSITHVIQNHYFLIYEYSYFFEFDDAIDREKSIWYVSDKEQIILNIE